MKCYNTLVEFFGVTFATQEFLGSARVACANFIKMGGTGVQIYSPQSINNGFSSGESEDPKVIDFSLRGAGYWKWKPLLIQKTLNVVKDGDYVVYFDAGVLLTKPIKMLIDLDEIAPIQAWSLKQGFNSLFEWTEPLVLDKLEIKLSEYSTPMLIGGILVVRKSKKSASIINNWVEWCDAPQLLCPDSIGIVSERPGFIWHRHDQSLLTILSLKYRNDFAIKTVSEIGVLTDSIPFLIHRKRAIPFLFVLFFQMKLKIIFRLLTNILPPAGRSLLRQIREKSGVSDFERKAHNSFYRRTWP